MKKSSLFLLSILFALSFNNAYPQHAKLRQEIRNIAAAAKGITGVAMILIEDSDTLSYNGNARMVMQSVMKFPIALTVLNQVDHGKLKMDQQLFITKNDLPKTYSPLRDKYPEGNVSVSIGELLKYSVSFSDNNACDILLKKIGGTKAVTDYLTEIKIQGISINASESQMGANWQAQYTNWCRPVDMAHLLTLFFNGDALTTTSTIFLMKIMQETQTGPKRIKNSLPSRTIVAHKTGTSGTNQEGLSPATNDIAIISLPDGKHLALAVFVCNSKADLSVREEVIANISKAAWDTFTIAK